MTLAELPLAIRWMLAIHEILRRLGFPPDDIYGVIARDPRWDWKLAVMLKGPGDREFMIDVARAPVNDAGRRELLKQMHQSAEIWNASSDAEIKPVFDAFVKRHGETWTLQLIAGLEAKGFQPRIERPLN